MSISEYLDSSPFHDIVRYSEHNALNAVAFVGTLRKHPYDPEKCLLLTAEQEALKWLEEFTIIEFRIGDILGADEMASPVDEHGTARSLVRLWVQKGAIAMRYEPFEVADMPLGPRESAILRTKLSASIQQRHDEKR